MQQKQVKNSANGQGRRFDSGSEKRAYESPELVCRGDVRSMTLGGSAGSGDSANSGFQKF